jgi:hypothetical protein
MPVLPPLIDDHSPPATLRTPPLTDEALALAVAECANVRVLRASPPARPKARAWADRLTAY